MNLAVGYRQLPVPDATQQLTFPVRVLYPTHEAPQLVPFGSYQLLVAPDAAAHQQLGWQFPTSIDRVYRIEKAQRWLGYAPRYTTAYLLRKATRVTS
jgi:hypothetical protein